jgi:hypothetical protein
MLRSGCGTAKENDLLGGTSTENLLANILLSWPSETDGVKGGDARIWASGKPLRLVVFASDEDRPGQLRRPELLLSPWNPLSHPIFSRFLISNPWAFTALPLEPKAAIPD